MEVYFYTFTKRVNSTAQPTGGTKYDCILKSPSAVVRPRIALVWSGAGTPAAFNYAYIADFGRYYWINDWTFADRQWVAQLSVDVLATYKTAIGASSKYVLRAASQFDEYLMDNLYPVSLLHGSYIRDETSGFSATTFSGGRIVLSISGLDNAFTSGGLGYVVLTPSDFQALLNFVYNKSESDWTGNAQTDIGLALSDFGKRLLTTVADPAQFLGRAVWYPFIPATEATGGILALAYIKTNITAYGLADPVWEDTYSLAYDGSISNLTPNWYKVAPYRRVMLYFTPFGYIELDTTRLLGYTTINLTVRVDVTSGQGTLIVWVPNVLVPTTADDILGVYTAQFGVPMSVGGVKTGDYAAFTANAVSGLVSGAAGNAAGMLSSVGNAALSMLPSVAPGGSSGGGYSAYLDTIKLFQIEYSHAQEDFAENGRPLCKTKTINTLSGFIQCRDGHVDDAAATLDELNQIESYLTGGFFYD